MIVYNKDVKAVVTEAGVERKILAYSDEMMMCEIKFEKGACGSVHSHPHLQITYVAEGKFEATVDGKVSIIEKGDSVYMPSNSVHGMKALEKGILVDIFNPKREDFLK